VARVGVAQASRLPTVSITGNYGSQSGTADDLFTGNTEVYQLQAGVSIPLFTGGRLANEARAAGARAEQARLQFEQTVLQAFREASDALVAVRVGDRRACHPRRRPSTPNPTEQPARRSDKRTRRRSADSR